MKTKCRRGVSALCVLLSAAMLTGLLLPRANATAADDQEYELLGELSSRYEGGDAGAISNNAGDIGGKSYGAYQFASASDTPLSFARWCQKSENEYYRYIGQTLEAAYYDGGAGYGNNFDAAWKQLAKENYDGFFACQRYYVNEEYYESIVDKVSSDVPGFDIKNYSIALRNVFLSRAIQHGTGGARLVMSRAFTALGGFANQPETELITAIYAESSKTRAPESDENIMTGVTARKYGVEGQTMHYYNGSSSEIQLGVFLRLRINEPAKAQNMLVTYGYADAPLGEGLYRLSPEGNADLALGSNDSSVVLNTLTGTEDQSFRLTYYASGYYIIENIATGLRLTASGDGGVALAKATTDHNQMWKLESLNSGFSLCNRSTGRYLTAAGAGSSAATGEDAMQWQVVKGGAAWSLDGASYPTYANILLEGESTFPFRGTLRCTYPIQSVKVSILNASGSNAISPASASGINAVAYDLSTLDNAVAFSRLKAGAYKLVIEATSSAAASGTYRLESDFYVTDGSYLLTFDACGGTASQASRSVVAGQAFGELPTATKDGHIFIGWFTAADGGKQVTASTTATAANQTVYAHYVKAYTYAFRNYDGADLSSGQLAAGSVIPAPTDPPTRPADETYYYVFTGWDGYTEGMTIAEDVVFTAQYEQRELEILPEITTDAYIIRDGFLRAIAIGTTPESLLSKLVPSEFITVTKGSAATEATMATGMTVEYTVNGEAVQTLTVVVTGDVNGDGAISITDLVQINNHLLKKSTLTGAAASAADVNADGVISITDLVQVNNHLLKKSTITPN